MRVWASESISAWHARAMHLVFFEMVKLLNAEVGGMSGVDEGSQRAAHSLQMCEKPWWQELLSNSRLESFAKASGHTNSFELQKPDTEHRTEGPPTSHNITQLQTRRARRP